MTCTRFFHPESVDTNVLARELFFKPPRQKTPSTAWPPRQAYRQVGDAGSFAGDAGNADADGGPNCCAWRAVTIPPKKVWTFRSPILHIDKSTTRAPVMVTQLHDLQVSTQRNADDDDGGWTTALTVRQRKLQARERQQASRSVPGTDKQALFNNHRKPKYRKLPPLPRDDSKLS
ncbi:hypothetical protein HPB52_002959 [Rhipicephalus sanguineus]|uniref:Uncharacterized protein n=1 Tax=Rhipicephalus sanguineus TaxID=34632 RepID=A0A9D4SPM0_RHISA|nr:hypothetical protein HPB52_002959 [Rhipicephalus sanguineus]